MGVLGGVCMEIDDCALVRCITNVCFYNNISRFLKKKSAVCLPFQPLVKQVIPTDDPEVAFKVLR